MWAPRRRFPGRRLGYHERGSEVEEAINKNVYAALQGEMSPDEAASTMNEQIQKAIETF